MFHSTVAQWSASLKKELILNVWKAEIETDHRPQQNTYVDCTLTILDSQEFTSANTEPV